jgi:3',5'-cyclic AMP phosphodiesterase CpdA
MSNRSLQRLARLLALAGLATAAGVMACGGPSRQSPVSPSAGRPLTASLSPTPMLTRTQDGTATAGARYQIAGELTFRAPASFSGRMTSIELTIMCASGEGGRGNIAIDVPIMAGGVAKYQLLELVQVSTGQEPQRLRVIAKGTDSKGSPFETAPLEITLITETRPNAIPDAIVLAAGDIAVCGAASTETTARLLDRMPGSVFALGDNAYPTGAAEHYANCYGPTWGRHRARTYPTPGNHEYEVAGAASYFEYFLGTAGPPGRGYYSFDLGAWHILSLNSNITANPGSAQYAWVSNDLDTKPSLCTLAFWHHPVFSSGSNGNSNRMRDIWRLLDEHRAEVVLVGHDHDYERFAPQDADGIANLDGVREFVVGTGGAVLRPTTTIQPNSQARESQTWGVLKLTLRPTAYGWEFMPIDGQTFRDFGMSACVP